MSKFPKTISRMIESAYRRGWSTQRIADHVNSSKTAKTLKVTYGLRTIAAKIANINR